jgi:hypothetical protein
MVDDNKTAFGQLERVSLRAAWESEARDFTPWLSNPANIKLLGDAVGLELEVQGSEERVGLFRADVLCKDVSTDSWVLIENQLERTDHGHLGQLLTYAAGLHAVTVIWVAAQFTEEHRAALDWLNEKTADEISFFGLEVELWRIGNSPFAPKFNIVSKPNDWTKTLTNKISSRGNSELSEAKSMQLEFWTGFREFALKNAKSFKPTKALPQHWLNIFIGVSGAQLCLVCSLKHSKEKSFSSNELRVELYVNGYDSVELFSHLQSDRDTIEKEIGSALEWYSVDGAKSRRAFLRRDTDLYDKNSWEESWRWLTEVADKFKLVFRPRLEDARAQFAPVEE